MDAILAQVRMTLGSPRLGLEEVGDVGLLFAEKPGEPPKRPRTVRRFQLRRPERPMRVRLSRRPDVEADAIIFDAQLGTLGLVHLLPLRDYQTLDPPNAALSRQIETCIDKAAYVKHLLLEDLRPGEPQAGFAPLCVEVVFVTTGGEGAPIRRQLGEVMRSIMQGTTFLHAFGINVCDLADFPAEASSPSTPGLRRAFAWLLTDTRAWYERLPVKPTACGNSAGATEMDDSPVQKILLRDFRLAGDRVWQLLSLDEASDPPRLHVVHGQNGSGKSSLAEAMELILAGGIERLSGEDHAKVITHIGAWEQDRRAGLEVLFASGEKLVGTLDQSTIRWSGDAKSMKRFATPLKPGTFRLHQKLADELSASSPGRRAQVVLEAFFPDHYAKLVAERAEPTGAAKSARQALEQLPARFRGRFLKSASDQVDPERDQVDPERVLRELAWVQPDQIIWEKLLELLAVTPTDLAALAALQPAELQAHLSRKGPVPSGEAAAAAGEVDLALRKMAEKAGSLVTALGEAAALLEEYGAVTGRKRQEVTGSLRTLFSRWQECVAVVDLLEKEHFILSTLEGAARKGYAFESAWRPLLADRLEARPAAEREHQLGDAKSRLAAARSEFERFETVEERAVAEGKTPRPFKEFNPAALDAVAQSGLFGEEFRQVTESLGKAVQRVFSDGEQEALVRMRDRVLLPVGQTGWGNTLAERARSARDAAQRLVAAVSESESLTVILDALKRLRLEAERMTRPSKEMQRTLESLLQHGGPLSCAVNELTALMTPARWAYHDVISRPDFTGTSESLGLEMSDKIAMAVRLNTAELNTFALALFLLCSRQQRNPLRLVVLDDPLQNMDELTVIAVARGLAKVLRLWQLLDRGAPSWSIVLMVHGEENVERLRNEASCITHVLPWLSPAESSGVSAPGTLPPIPRRPALFGQEVQKLDHAIEAV